MGVSLAFGDAFGDMAAWAFLAAAAAAGLFAFRRIRFPAPEVTGPLIFLAVATLAGFKAPHLPYWLNLGLQIIIGAGVGYQVDSSTIRSLRQMLVPAVIILAWTIATTLGLGWVLGRLSGLGAATATLSACPGGLTEMTVMAISFDANPPVVLAFQLARFLGTLLVMPFIVVRMSRPNRRAGLGPSPAEPPQQAAAREAAACGIAAGTVRKTLLGLAVAVAGGAAGAWVGLPAPGLLGSLLAVASARLVGLDFARPPFWVRDTAAAGLGAVVGVMFTLELAQGMVSLALPVVVLTVGLVVTAIAVGLAVQKATGWDLMTCLFSASPAGMSQMVFLADSYGCDAVKVSLLHLVRYLTVVAVTPLLISLLP